jgi:hypothetical protein
MSVKGAAEIRILYNFSLSAGNRNRAGSKMGFYLLEYLYNHVPPLSSPEVKERVELYLYFPSEPSYNHVQPNLAPRLKKE